MNKIKIMQKPTKKGLEKYPPDGIYKGDFPNDKNMWGICTCKDICKIDCKGECGCEACRLNYMDFLSLD